MMEKNVFAPEPLLTLGEAMQALRVSRNTLISWSHKGLLNPVVIKVPGARTAIRRWRVREVQALIDGAGAPAPTAGG